jgi:hypothetical protein
MPEDLDRHRADLRRASTARQPAACRRAFTSLPVLAGPAS